MKALWTLMCFFFVLPHAAFADGAGESSAPAAATAPITADDVRLQPLDDFEYTEGYYLVGELEGSIRLYLVYSVTNMGLRAGAATLQATLIFPDGKIETEKLKAPKKEIKTTQAPFGMKFGDGQSLQIGLAQSRFEFQGEKIQLNAELTPLISGYKFGDGKTATGEEGQFVSYVVLTPRGRLSGEAVVDGKSVPLNGYAYLEHTRQNIGGHKFIDRVFSFRSFSGDESVNFFAAIYDGRIRNSVLTVTRGDRVVLAKNGVNVDESAFREGKTGPRYKLPEKLRVEPIGAELKLTKLVQEDDLLADMNFLERKFVNMLVADPRIFRYWASYEIPLPDGTVAKGVGMVEAIYLRKR